MPRFLASLLKVSLRVGFLVNITESIVEKMTFLRTFKSPWPYSVKPHPLHRFLIPRDGFRLKAIFQHIQKFEHFSPKLFCPDKTSDNTQHWKG